MKQSRAMSLVEAVANVVVGYALADGGTFLLRQSDLDGPPPAMGSSVGVSLSSENLRVLLK